MFFVSCLSVLDQQMEESVKAAARPVDGGIAMRRVATRFGKHFLVLTASAFFLAFKQGHAAPALDTAIAFWESSVVRFCEGYPSKDECDDGDSVLFNGLLCSAGDERGCAGVRDAQGADGRWWRAPRRIDGNLGQSNSFSRDMSLGVLLYLATTRDVEAAQNWMRWIQSNRACAVVDRSSGDCLRYAPVYRLCRDDQDLRCTITPALWAVIARVWDWLDLPLTSSMQKNRNADLASDPISAQWVKPGFEAHLLGVTVLVNRIVAERERVNRFVARRLLAIQPTNPFYQFLAGVSPERVAGNLLSLCKKPEDDLNFSRHQWAWERNMAGAPWQESMGWDCIFLAKLLQRNNTPQ
jgi:hypothetical protein